MVVSETGSNKDLPKYKVGISVNGIGNAEFQFNLETDSIKMEILGEEDIETGFPNVLDSFEFRSFRELMDYIWDNIEKLNNELFSEDSETVSEVVFELPITTKENGHKSIYITLPVNDNPNVRMAIPADFMDKEKEDDKKALNEIMKIARERVFAWMK